MAGEVKALLEGVDWRQMYKEKHELMLERGYEEVSPHDFYRDLFPEGSLQNRRESNDGKGNIIATQVRMSGTGRTRQWVVTDDLKMLDKVVGDPFGLIAPISYFGKTHLKMNAHDLFALAIDIDFVGTQQLKNLLKQFGNGVQMKPTYLVSSGRGVHVYYFLKKPLPLYPELKDMYHDLKVAFIRRLWNDTSSMNPDAPDITGIYQGFRCVGSQSKLGAEYPTRAYRISENRYSLEDMQAFFKGWHKDIDLSPIGLAGPNKPKKKPLTLEKAKELYPGWYQRKIEGKKPEKKKYVSKEALYEWWKRKIQSDVIVGGRYFSLVALCAYGLKCGISEWHIRRDAYAFLDYLETLTEDEDNHFKRSDVTDALKALSSSKKEITYLTTREWIEQQTKVSIPPTHRKKGERLKQSVHLELARASRDIRQKAKGTKWTDNNGRPDKEQIVLDWRKTHPDGRKAECIRDTGLSKKTVYKWWEPEKKKQKVNLDVEPVFREMTPEEAAEYDRLTAGARQMEMEDFMLSEPVAEYQTEEESFPVDFGDGDVVYMTKSEIEEYNRSKWHKELPEFYVVKGDPNLLQKVAEMLKRGARSVEFLSPEEEKYLLEKRKNNGL